MTVWIAGTVFFCMPLSANDSCVLRWGDRGWGVLAVISVQDKRGAEECVSSLK